MDRSWKILFAAVAVVIIWFASQKKQEDEARALRVQALAACFDQNDFKPRRPFERVRAHFFQALAQLHENLAAEPAPGFLHRSRHDPSWYLDEALAPLDVPDPERTLLKTAMINGYAETRSTFGVFQQSSGREDMAAGREPTITLGTFAGERLRIGWKVSPVLIPEIANHPANFNLMPALAWGLQQERIDDASASAAREFFRDGLLSEAGWQLVQDYLRDTKKND